MSPPTEQTRALTVAPEGGVFKVAQESGPFYENASLLVSLVALLVSLYSAFSTIRKDRAARRRSIHDEFWLRKIISPQAIEGFSEDVLALLERAPDPTSSLDERKLFGLELTKSMRVSNHRLQFLRLLDPALAASVATRFESFEDDVTRFVFPDEIDPDELGSRITRTELRQRTNDMLIEIFEQVRSHQSSKL